MKKKVIFFLAIAICSVVISDFLTNYAHTNFWGAPVRSTGSPLDGQTCQQANCHTSNVPVQNGGLVTSNIPASGYIPGNTYTITASITGSAVEFGFQVSPQNSTGIVGDLVSTNNQVWERDPGYMTHTQAGNRGNGSKTWSFDWVAPVSGTGDVTFYAAFLVSNFNFTTTGDTTKTTSLAVTEDISAKDITSFRFNALNPQVIGTINPNTQNINLTVPYGTDITNLVPTINHTGDSINPASGIANDFSSPQIYTIWAINASTKSYTVSVDIDSTGVAVTEQSLKQSFEIYPNPVADYIHLKQSPHYKFIRISIINKNGMTLKVFTTPKSIERFDISDLSPGIYFIKAETEKERIIKKIVKQ